MEGDPVVKVRGGACWEGEGWGLLGGGDKGKDGGIGGDKGKDGGDRWRKDTEQLEAQILNQKLTGDLCPSVTPPQSL